ncbi:MAG TPA: hypothetical protein DCX17_03750 [Firmicutes bacterium]|jgi:uncharacterized protein YrzB (UPF0473 family)|nr:hypothetical protein [Bacillota bacterium]
MKFEKDNQILITKDDGGEVMMEILFTYEDPETEKTYVLYFDPENPDDILASRYDKSDELFDLEGEEYEKISAILDHFLDELTEDED